MEFHFRGGDWVSEFSERNVTELLGVTKLCHEVAELLRSSITGGLIFDVSEQCLKTVYGLDAMSQPSSPLFGFGLHPIFTF
jgi:hypothetical protein